MRQFSGDAQSGICAWRQLFQRWSFLEEDIDRFVMHPLWRSTETQGTATPYRRPTEFWRVCAVSWVSGGSTQNFSDAAGQCPVLWKTDGPVSWVFYDNNGVYGVSFCLTDVIPLHGEGVCIGFMIHTLQCLGKRNSARMLSLWAVNPKPMTNPSLS